MYQCIHLTFFWAYLQASGIDKKVTAAEAGVGPPPFIPFSSVKKSRKNASNIGFSTRKVSHAEHPVRRDGGQSANKTAREVQNKENHDKRTDYPNNFTSKSSKTLIDNKPPINPGIRGSQGGGGTDSGKQHHQRQGYGRHTWKEDKRSNTQNPNVDGREGSSARTDRSQDRGSQNTATARPQTTGPRREFQRNQVFSSALQSASIGNIRESAPKSSHSSDKAQSQPVCDSKGSRYSTTESTQKYGQSQQRVHSEGNRHSASEPMQKYGQSQQRVHSEGNRHSASEPMQKYRQSQQRVHSEGNRHNASEPVQKYGQSQHRVHSEGNRHSASESTQKYGQSQQRVHSEGNRHNASEPVQKYGQSQHRVHSEGNRHSASESTQKYGQSQQRVHSEGNRHNASEPVQKYGQSQHRVHSEGNRHSASESTQKYRQSQQRVHSGGRKDVPTKHTEPSDGSPQVKKAPREPVTQPQFNSQSRPQNEPQRKGVPFSAKRVDVSSSVPTDK